MRQHDPDPPGLRGRSQPAFSQAALSLGGLAGHKMTSERFVAFKLAAAGRLEPLGRAFSGLHLRHIVYSTNCIQYFYFVRNASRHTKRKLKPEIIHNHASKSNLKNWKMRNRPRLPPHPQKKQQTQQQHPQRWFGELLSSIGEVPGGKNLSLPCRHYSRIQ